MKTVILHCMKDLFQYPELSAPAVGSRECLSKKKKKETRDHEILPIFAASENHPWGEASRSPLPILFASVGSLFDV